MNYEQLKTAIAEVIRTNGNEEITGEVLQYILIEMVSALGRDYQFAGVATPSTEVGEPDENKAWILRAGSYENFGTPFTVAENQFGVVMFNGSFDVRLVTVGRPVDDSITEGGVNPVEGGAIAAEFAQMRAAGYLFAGLATTATEPPAERPEKIFYLASQGGIYAGFGVTVPQGISVIKWNGNTWSVDTLWRVDDEPTDDSQNLVKSGGVVTALGTKVDKVEGKGLSEQDYTTSEKQKLADLPTALQITEMLALKQDVLVWDNVPTEDSTNAISSGAVYEAIKDFITKAVNDLVNYYTKQQTYSKTEVDNLIAAIKQFRIMSVQELPTASADTVGILYLIPSAEPGTQNIKDEYITLTRTEDGVTTYYWEQIGSTEIDLSNYPTIDQMNTAIATALEDYLTGTEVGALIATAIAGVADLSIEVNPAIILTNQAVAINLTARSQVAADSLMLTRGGSQVAIGSGTMLTAIDNVNIQTAGVLTYLLTAVIAGVTRTKEVTLDVVDAVYYGAGTSAAAITTKATARRTPAGRYNITATAGDNLFVLVPYGMTVNGLRMSGIDVPMEVGTVIVVDDKTYHCYQSSNVYDAGSYTIEVY